MTDSQLMFSRALFFKCSKLFYMIDCDFEPHHYLPIYLKKEQVKNPMSVMADFFQRYDLPTSRLFLWQLLKQYVCEHAKGTLLDYSACFCFYEEIICFIEAANLLLKQNQENSGQEKRISGLMPATEKISSPFDNPEAPLFAVIRIIKNSMDVEKIFLLGKYLLQPPALEEEYDLMILVRENCNRSNDEFESLVQNRSLDTVPVHSNVYKVSKVNELIRNGNYFFSTCCIPENLIYDAGRIHLEMLPAKQNFPDREELRRTHKNILEKANGFLLGAANYYTSKEYSLCGFMLHQAAEHGLNSLLQPLMQFRIQTHNLHKLMRNARRFSLEIFNLFPRNTDREIKLFQLLQKAYIHARYKDSFEVKAEDAEVLLDRIKVLLEKIGEEFERIVKTYKGAFDDVEI